MSFKIAIGVYILAAIITFGYADNHSKCNRWANTLSKYDDDHMSCNSQAFANGLFGGAFWPLYWSWNLQQNMDEEND